MVSDMTQLDALVADEFPLGSRVDVGGHKGTVLYLGSIDGLKGVWLGIDWDDATRGKHDGCVKGKKYFAASGPRSGSFVRPNAVNKGRPLLEAVKEKYQQWTSADENAFLGHLVGSKEIEFVGMDKVEFKQSNLARLREVVVDGMCVSRAGSSDELARCLPCCRELDLNNNLLWEWGEILYIVKALPKLRFLNLSKNKMRALREGDYLNTDVAEKIKKLSLYDCDLSTNDVEVLVRIFSAVEELGLCSNRIGELRVESGALQNLQLLDLEANSELDWTGIRAVWFLPNLEVLNLTRTNVSSIICPEEGMFPSLRLLYLCKNKISEWNSINELSRLCSLAEVMLQGNPVMEIGDRLTNRQIVEAKIPRLKVLNREVVTASDRRGAEIDYLKRFGPQWIAANKAGEENERRKKLNAFHVEHPQFQSLVKKYGAPEESEMVAEMRPKGVLKNELIRLTILVDSSNHTATAVPSSMTVQKVKSLVGRLCKRNPRTLDLVYESRRRPGLFVPLDNDVRELIFYSIEDGDTIHVKRKHLS